MFSLLSTAVWLAVTSRVYGRALTWQATDSDNDTSIGYAGIERSLVARADDPTNFNWVHKLVAIGDSYTAGIGSGNQRGSDGDWGCSRYDYAYPELINNMIGPWIDSFQFLACSGDRSVQIYDQIAKMNSDTDMVIMTAGGNDLCLAAMIKKCVMLPYSGESTCQAVIDKAQQNIDSILKPNLKQILKAMDGKVRKGGVVVYNGYARFFNTENEDCANNQAWNYARWFPAYWFSTPLKLTTDRRKKFNDLVTNINAAISDVVKDVSDEVGYTIGFSDWDLWPIEGVKGQMCDPSSTGFYPDPKQPDLQFFKPDTHIPKWSGHDELRRDVMPLPPAHVDENGIDTSIYDSLLWKSINPGAEVLHRLDKRAPAPPDCPGDKDWIDPTLGLGVPDSFGKLFHPNELGHETIASFSIASAINLRAKVLGLGKQSCEVIDEFKCWQKEGRKGYATADKLNENYKDFCESVKPPNEINGWSFEKSYFEGTPDEHSFKLQLSDKVNAWDKNQCLESMDRIINSCDGNDPNNPMNWKFGGSWRRGELTYEVNIKRDNRPWPPIKAAYGKCHGQYYAFFSGYSMYGAGFSSWDWGQKTVLPCMKGCLGLGVTAWKFEYFDKPDDSGMEWKATYNTPIWTNARCFANNKVVGCAGGFTNGCSGTG